MMLMRSAIALILAVPLCAAAAERPYDIRNAPVYRVAGRFGGWPANHGIWNWGNEILVGFSAAWYQQVKADVHQYDRSKPEVPNLARSLDGGITWTIEAPESLLPPEQGGKAVTTLAEPMDFTHPDFAMTLRLSNIDDGGSRLSYSLDRGRTWRGPYRFPMLGLKGIMARTDYILLGKREALVFLTASKTNGKEGRPFVARTTDGGLNWQFVSWIGPEPPGFAIMPSALRLAADEYIVAVRCKDGMHDWIDMYRSADGARTWTWISRPTATDSAKSGNPPAMVRLKDGRVCLTYGQRSLPYGIFARISSDGGKTWGEEIVLRDDGAAWDLGYCRTVLRPDGRVVTAYYFAADAKKERTIEATIWSPPAPGLRIERVFGPEIKTGPYKHPATIAELANGDLYLVYYGGAGEYAVSTSVWGARLKKGELQWTEPVPIARDPFRSVGNGVVWQAPDGLVWLFYVVRHGETWSDSRIQGKVSRDNAETWSDAFVVAEEPGMMVRGRPQPLAGGDFLVPVYHETGHDPEMVGKESTSLFLRFDAAKHRWSTSAPIRSANGNIQPAVATLDDGKLVAYCRRGGGYGPGTSGYIVRAESADGGKTWSEGKDSAFPNPNAAVDFLRLSSGSLLLVFNDSMVDRTPLTVALSRDQDRTWPVKRNLAEGNYDYGYPYAIQARDGRIHVVYTSHHRTVVNHAVFEESWLASAER
jgi:predicted neuraminidase